MKPNLKLILFILLLTRMGYVNAQQFVGLYNVSFPANPSVPAYTAGPAAIKKADGTNPNSGALSVSASFSDQQYGLLPNGLTGFGDLGLMFGISNNNSNKVPTPASVGVQLANVGSPVNSYYSALTNLIGTGMNTFNNYAFNMFASAEGLSGQPTNGRYYFGKVTFSFSRPVINPILHVTGLGGFLSINEPPFPTLPFAVDLELDEPGFQISKLSGTARTQLNVTTKTIFNSFDYLQDYIIDGRTPEGGNFAGTGSFLITGINVTTVTFKVYLRGMTQNQVWTSNANYQNAVYNGDRFNMSWTLPTQPESTLPATGVNLKAVLNGTDVVLTWKTVSEINSKEFEIERSADGVNYTRIASKNAAGNSFSEISYSFTDAAMAKPVYFYRLKLVDNDRSYTYSNVAVVRKSGSSKEIKTFPNPMAAQLNIEFNKAKGSYVISMFNQAGQEVRTIRAFIDNDVQYVNISRGTLTAGTYAVRITNIITGEVSAQKVIIQ
ncbi:MAG: T9SS type A sorting domain-containing protein [Chitinophagaceae bacterium]|jgi:hypothetical protein|nr:T9SS type A sorting domain-containing protein [Chitinophagaceae bacterium]